MLITLFTDASHCRETNLAAYAVWAKANGRVVRHVGMLRERVAGSDLAETMAVVNGIHIALTALQPEPGSKIIAQTDCITAIVALGREAKKGKTRRKFAGIRTAYLAAIAAAGITVELRHVKGHKGMVTPRNAVNTWADRECRRLMRQARAELTAQAPADG